MINLVKLNKNATIPTRGSKDAAGYDLYACIEREEIIAPGETKKIQTGVAIALNQGTFGAIFARSGLATKEGLRPANCVGVVDSDYRGEIIVAIHNDSDVERVITNGERIAQFVILPFFVEEFNVVDNLYATERGEGGFGSTGK